LLDRSKAGYAKTDVTPHEPVCRAGYDMRGMRSDGIHGAEKLYVRAIVFEVVRGGSLLSQAT